MLTPALSGETIQRRSRVSLRVASPAAGADWSVTVPAGHRYDLLAITATLATSAVVASRLPRLIIGDGNATFLRIPPVASQAASLTGLFLWAVGLEPYALAPDQVLPLPLLSLEAGWTVGGSTGALDAGDQWSAVTLSIFDSTIRAGERGLDRLPDAIVQVTEPGP